MSLWGLGVASGILCESLVCPGGSLRVAGGGVGAYWGKEGNVGSRGMSTIKSVKRDDFDADKEQFILPCQ